MDGKDYLFREAVQVKIMPSWWVVIAMIYWEWALFKRTDTAHGLWIRDR